MTPARKARRIAVSQGAILDELRYPADGDAPSFAALAACDGSGHIVIDERTWLADCEAVRARVEGSAPMVDPLGLVGLGPCPERYFTLADDSITAVPTDIHGWDRILSDRRRILAQNDVGHFHVSTVFLGMDHNFGLLRHTVRPHLWETMVFNHADGAEHWEDLACWREPTWARAAARHRLALRLVRWWLS